MMIELAIGDAYGAGFEYSSQEIIQKNKHKWKYIPHQKHPLQPGDYTDDTQMSISLAELLLEEKEFTSENIASKFVEVFKRDPRKGYSDRIYNLLDSSNNGKEFLEKINLQSYMSGSAMRAGPIGFLPNIEDVKNYAIAQAKTTHNTEEGRNAAMASALMTHYFIHDLGKKENLMDFIKDNVPGEWFLQEVQDAKGTGYNCVRAAATAIIKHNSLQDILLQCIDWGGDVDTVATIAMASASCSKEIDQKLPKPLFDKLENGRYGKDYLVGLDFKLKNKYLSSNPK